MKKKVEAVISAIIVVLIISGVVASAMAPDHGPVPSFPEPDVVMVGGQAYKWGETPPADAVHDLTIENLEREWPRNG